MKQLLQNLTTGNIDIVEVPAPRNAANRVSILTSKSLVSAGTERMLAEFARASYIEKARQQPDKVKEVLNKVKTDGLLTTIDAVRSKLDQPLELGYCNVGTVSYIGEQVKDVNFKVGDRVISNGSHSERVAVPKNLIAKIPDNVPDEAACFTVLSAIGLQGIRLSQPTLGENYVVLGLGLIGLLTVQMLRANGCNVLGIDFNDARLNLAADMGAEVINAADSEVVLKTADEFSRGKGVDAVLITAATDSNGPITQAAKMCRQRGRIVLVGVTGLQLQRDLFFKKELTFQVSCSYGPGRYDSLYEDKGIDYPLAHVRWTEQRNFEAVLGMMAAGSLDPRPLITHKYNFLKASKAYDTLLGDKKALGILLDYSSGEKKTAKPNQIVQLPENVSRTKKDSVGLTIIGAGNYASRVLIPAFRKSGANLSHLVSEAGINATHYGKKYGFQFASNDAKQAIEHADTDAVVIATRHDTHAEYVLRALKAGKSVFCEKPLCLSSMELNEIEKALHESQGTTLMVGFNRRFSPHVMRIHDALRSVRAPKFINILVNAGHIPAEHWTQDFQIGGGRIIGEACHFIDLARHLVGHPISDISSANLQDIAQPKCLQIDKSAISITFADGSVASIAYMANGHKSFPKERIEVFADGKILQLNNFRSLKSWGLKGQKNHRTMWQDKGQNQCAQAFIDCLRNGDKPPIAHDEIFEVMGATLQISNGA